MPESYPHCIKFLKWDMEKTKPTEIGDAIGLAQELGAAFRGVNASGEVVYGCREVGCSALLALGANALHERNDEETYVAGMAICEHQSED